MSRALVLIAALALAAHAREARAQEPAETPRAVQVSESVYVRDLGPGRPGRLLRDALRGPRLVLRPRARVVVGREDVLGATTIVLGPRVEIGGRVRGDLIVVGGDAFVHPGGVVEGRAIAIGGCVYPSALGTVRGGIRCYEDETFDVQADAQGRLALGWRPLTDRSVALLQWPLGTGLRIPSYDRVNGLSAGIGPVVNLDTGRITIEPVLTYRSHLGNVDPGAFARAELGRRTSVSVRAQRGTFTNERWIRDSLVNSVLTVVNGRDVRNYYRADRIDAVLRRRWETATATFEPFVGALTERAWSAGPDTARRGTASVPWSLFSRNDSINGMRRANPRVRPGRITSALAGVDAEWEAQDLVGELVATIEAAPAAPGGGRFAQLMLDADVRFPVVRNHTLRMQLHVLTTASDGTPAQRYSYVGGSGSIPTLDLLSLGGDQLLHLDSRYAIPFERIRVPFLGSPELTVRHVIGGAGVGRLPALVQNVGPRVTIGFLRGELMIDPASGTTNGSVGVALGR